MEDSHYIVEADEYPALVDLLAPGVCIATLISHDWLITAAHCAELLRLPATLVIGGHSAAVDSVKLPSTWQDDLDDIALIKLNTPNERRLIGSSLARGYWAWIMAEKAVRNLGCI